MTRSRRRRSYENTTPQLLSIHKSIHALVVIHPPHPPNAGQCAYAPTRTEPQTRSVSTYDPAISCMQASATATHQPHSGYADTRASLNRCAGSLDSSAGRRMSLAQKDSRIRGRARTWLLTSVSGRKEDEGRKERRRAREFGG
jgi:hypothetical protein